MAKVTGIFRAAKRSPKEARDFARDNTFARRDHIPVREFDAPTLSLELVLQHLHDSGINAGLQAFCCTGLVAWIGASPLGKNQAEAELGTDDAGWRYIAGSLPLWLHRTAIRLFPDGRYAHVDGVAPAAPRPSIFDSAATGVPEPRVRPFDAVPFPEDEPRIPPRGDGVVPTLETVVKDLHDSEINVGVQTYCPTGLRVCIGDQLNGLRLSAHIGPNDAGWLRDGTIALWLHEAALKLSPRSEYARRFVP